ncbi:MAG: DNA-directed RNA polymerase subunit alpha [Candidatus Onthomorpha sp.]|nr:DNA-directed RNA polymerase subunit alpha [Bacteroidales bacterium]MDY3976735.1 DNA-directed RNA polymerase subunit alpha [Candidatus Onthomorpha sp.]MCI5715420.1 DNA-directed RNA polymerase subunit alpha [Bacteroidales bacterium]MCI6417096.1 DNA-directed RNA polymerase subunit alpha [Bacteroidales bacterium]MCI6645089.1 DNA-directed RNA polymerase subunit alpha [Bacteroidales bacterium]
MAILAFQQPDKVIMIESDDFKGTFEFRPLEPRYGVTIGNALRRILVSSLEGFAITSIKIDGVNHEFDTIPGVIEDMTEIILNLKQLRFKRQIETEDRETVSFKIEGKNVFKAGDINQYLSGFQILNTEVEICHMEPSVCLSMEITIEKGRGYVPAEENKKADDAIGTIAIDSIFTPIKNVNYTVDNYRVEHRIDYEKLTIEVTTDGSITPKDALKEAASILIQHFLLFSDEKISIKTDSKTPTEEFDEATLHIRQLLKTKLLDLDLSVRALNCLKSAEVETLGDLVAFNKQDLLKFRNFGRKSLTELENLVKSKNLEFGMNVSKYKLEKE